jgi:hypothetical protein
LLLFAKDSIVAFRGGIAIYGLEVFIVCIAERAMAGWAAAGVEVAICSLAVGRVKSAALFACSWSLANVSGG